MSDNRLSGAGGLSAAALSPFPLVSDNKGPVLIFRGGTAEPVPALWPGWGRAAPTNEAGDGCQVEGGSSNGIVTV